MNEVGFCLYFVCCKSNCNVTTMCRRSGLQHLLESWKGDLLGSRVRAGGRSGAGVGAATATDLPGSAMVRLAGAYAVGPPSRVVGTEGFARLLDPWSAGGSVLQHPAALPAAASVLGIVSLLVSLAFSVAVVSAPRPVITALEAKPVRRILPRWHLSLVRCPSFCRRRFQSYCHCY
jgi:hypothetical protein